MKGPARVRVRDRADQVFGNDWLFPQGHVIQLQVGQQDSPFARPDNEPSSIQISQLHVRFPTTARGR